MSVPVTDGAQATAVTDFTPQPLPLSVVVPSQPAEVASLLTSIERQLRADSSWTDALDEWGARQQLVFRRLGRDLMLWAEVRPLLPPDVVGPADRTMEAAATLAAKAGGSSSPPPATLPAWSIVAPLPAEELLGYYREAEAETGVPWSLLAAIHLQETRMGRIVGVSSAGALGPMQFLPSTWAECCSGDPTSTRDAIHGAAVYLAGGGAPGDLPRAVHRYNPNDAYVTAVLAYHANMAADERAYAGYHGWQVFVGSAAGAIRLPVGYAAAEPIDALSYAATHPEDLVG